MISSNIFEEYRAHLNFKKVTETGSCFIALSSDDIVVIIDKPVVKTIEHKLETIKKFNEISNGKVLPCIYDPSQMKGMEKGVRKLTKNHVNQMLSHVAIINPSPTFNVILAFLLKVDRVKIKHKAFNKIGKAVQWVNLHRVKSRQQQKA